MAAHTARGDSGSRTDNGGRVRQGVGGGVGTIARVLKVGDHTAANNGAGGSPIRHAYACNLSGTPTHTDHSTQARLLGVLASRDPRLECMDAPAKMRNSRQAVNVESALTTQKKLAPLSRNAHAQWSKFLARRLIVF